jgi:2-polyprenyl-3-methyl-5-hydroxy-6-metoxy-1,4-benzoquinol methylase
MLTSRDFEVDDSEGLFLRDFDRREIDAIPPTFWTRMYLARLALLQRIVREVAPADGRILDVGCATGNLTILLAEQGFRCIGVDLRPGFLRYAERKDDRDLDAWVAANGHRPPFRDGSFDVVILGEIVEHVAEPDDLMERAMRLTTESGALICTTPNGAAVRIRALPSYAEASRDLDDLRARQFGPAGADHLFALRPDEMVRLAPEVTEVSLRYSGSGLWNRLTGVVAPSHRISEVIERVSSSRPMRRSLCQSLVAVYRRPG